jgi:hypothetical protein
MRRLHCLVDHLHQLAGCTFKSTSSRIRPPNMANLRTTSNLRRFYRRSIATVTGMARNNSKYSVTPPTSSSASTALGWPYGTSR